MRSRVKFSTGISRAVMVVVFSLAMLSSLASLGQTPPSITQQPLSQSLPAGTNAIFTVTATGSPTLRYQWSFNGTSLPGNYHVSGWTNAMLIVSNLVATNAGNYQVVVTNRRGRITSSNATLTVLFPPVFTNQPVSQSELLGSSAVFTATVDGTAPLHYRWYFNGALLADAGRISGSLTRSLTISNVQLIDAGGYVLVVSNLVTTVTSSNATLTPLPVTHYVNLASATPAPPYASWSTAATNIQNALDVANAGETILVTNGIYSLGIRVAAGTTNRVAATNALLLASVSGPDATVIDGGGTVSCVYLADGSSLAGFTVTNGTTSQNGGGIFCATTNVTITNCLVTGNSAAIQGGGVYQGTLVNCTFTSNSAAGNALGYPGGGAASSSVLNHCLLRGNFSSNYGMGGALFNCTANQCILTNNSANLSLAGGAAQSTLNNCLLVNNYAGSVGGAAYQCTLNNCTVVGNTANFGPGGGADACVVNNCIIYYNASPLLILFGGTPDQTNCANSVVNYSCCDPLMTNGVGNITNAPLFVDQYADWHLQSNSPCINAGSNSYVTNSPDLDGNPRIVGATVDPGAYEYQPPTIAVTVQPLSQMFKLQQNVQFNAAAISPFALGYHWLFNGAPLTDGGRISGAATTNLTITNLQATDTGNYTLQFTNFATTAFSSNAALRVNSPPPGVPYILSFSPVSAGPGTPVTITGLNFSPVATNNLVWFGSVAAPVLFANPSNLVVTVPPGAIDAPITVNVGGLVAYAFTPFVPTFVGDGSAISTRTFGPLLNLDTGPYPLSIAVADFDGDGKPDIVVADTVNHYLSLFRNTSTAGILSFAPRVDLPPIPMMCCPGDPNMISVGDVDGDGKPDILVSDWINVRVLIYQNISTPGTLTTNSFATPIGFGVNGDVINVRVADLDGDGRPDIFSANHASGTISILHNTGTPGLLTSGSFAPHFDLVTGGGAFDVVAVDLDGDGKPDLAAANADSPRLSLFRNISVPGTLDATSFQARVDLPALTNCWTLIAADVDGDGKVDLVDGSHNGGGMAVYRNLASPGPFTTNSFAPMVSFSTAGWVASLAAGDLNGDGKPDIVAVGTPSVFQNLSTPGSFNSSSLGARVDFPTGNQSTVVVDLDGDGRPEIVACNGSGISIFPNQSPFDGPPIIVAQPPDQTVSVNTTATFNAFVSGKAPLSYNWYFHGTNLLDGGRISGSTTNSVNIASIQAGDAGPCYLIVTNFFGSVTSRVATLTPVVLPPAFTQSPSSQTNILGSNITFTAGVSGSQPMTSQWLFNGTPLTDGGRISGSTTNTLTITGLLTNDAGGYQLVLSNAANVVTSTVASLTILVPPLFTQSPSNLAVILSSNATFTAVVDGTPPFTYQWSFNGSPLADNGHISGSMTTNLTIANVQVPDVGNYTIAVTNAAGSTNAVAALSISTPIIFTQPPANMAVLAGANVSFGVGVTGQQPLAFQWLCNNTNVDGATNNPIVLTNVLVSQAGTYSVIVTNNYGTAVSSNGVLNVAAFSFITQPTNRVAWLGGSATFRVNVSGKGPFSFEWQCNHVDVPGLYTNVLTLTNLSAAQFGTYSVIVSNPYGSVTSTNVALLFSQVAAWGGFFGETNLTAGLSNVVAIAAGISSTIDSLALKNDGRVVEWPSSPSIFVTTNVTNLVSVACAGSIKGPNLGLRPDGRMISWSFDSPQFVAGLTNIAAIAPFNYSYLALRTNGTVINALLQGDPPPIVTNLGSVVAIAEGYQHSMALKSDGTVVIWGNNQYFQTNVPVGLSNVVAIAAGGYHSLALKADSTVVAWGRALEHQTIVPTGLSNVVAIAGGGYHSLALKSDGTVVGWGLNQYGETNTPPGLSNVVAIAAGDYFSLALMGNGPPVLQVPAANPVFATNNFSLTLPTQSGKVYVLEYMNSVTDTNWTALPLVPGNGGIKTLTDPSATNSLRIYRVQQW